MDPKFVAGYNMKYVILIRLTKNVLYITHTCYDRVITHEHEVNTHTYNQFKKYLKSQEL